ncbi:hypothetical protein F511_35700 [Dorcoceras hygrometricum]|uniref:Uncharacterized protein n=1 Tax=Dorcoceras hygrometricum TaxID=472368 RepID=A0A2Z7ASK5_9LAMI|nr:hypothetical protein F511_35700 [Dorcoceras hygrometricum]
MKQLVRKDVNNSGVESAVEEVNKPDVVVQLLTYQMLMNRGKSAVVTTNSKIADERYEENQQLSEQLLSELLRINEDASAVAMKKSCYQTLITCGAADQIRSSGLSAGSHTVAAGVHLLRIGVHLERGSVTHPLMEPSEEEEGEM